MPVTFSRLIRFSTKSSEIFRSFFAFRHMSSHPTEQPVFATISIKTICQPLQHNPMIGLIKKQTVVIHLFSQSELLVSRRCQLKQLAAVMRRNQTVTASVHNQQRPFVSGNELIRLQMPGQNPTGQRNLFFLSLHDTGNGKERPKSIRRENGARQRPKRGPSPLNSRIRLSRYAPVAFEDNQKRPLHRHTYYPRSVRRRCGQNRDIRASTPNNRPCGMPPSEAQKLQSAPHCREKQNGRFIGFTFGIPGHNHAPVRRYQRLFPERRHPRALRSHIKLIGKKDQIILHGV